MAESKYRRDFAFLVFSVTYNTMFISYLEAENYRCFCKSEFIFRPGVNVIIGENNAGKTAVLSAIGLIFNRENRRRPQIHDFHQGITAFDVAPVIRVTVRISSSSQDTIDDKAVVATWLTKLKPTWEATLTYECFLPEKDAAEFMNKVGQTPERSKFFETLEIFLPKYVSRIYGGNPSDRIVAEHEMLSKFDYQFLNALRDVQSEMFTGSNPILKSMLHSVLDNGVNDAEQETRKQAFTKLSGELRDHVVDRLDLGTLFQLVAETGAGDGGTLNLAGKLDVDGIISALKLFVSWLGNELPVVCNGLGYNNLVYISLILASMDFKSDPARQSSNAVVFPILLVEEPEAHLHPALQYRLLKYLQKRINEAGKSRQVFITTHSTHITSACPLDSLICLAAPEVGMQPETAYPGRVFGDSLAGQSSKKYVERFLDATKSNMLFARSVIFVEGLAEQLVVPKLAEAAALPLEEYHVGLIAVDGSTFKHFLPLFGACLTQDLRKYALKRRVACLVDADPARKIKGDTQNRKGCFPFEIGRDNDKYEYYDRSGVVTNLEAQIAITNNISINYNMMTFEYDFSEANSGKTFLLTEKCKNKSILENYCIDPPNGEELLITLLNKLRPTCVVNIEAIEDTDQKHRAWFAACYFLSVMGDKGENAFDLAIRLNDADQIAIPDYILQALRWVTKTGNAEEGVDA
ncbi:MAG: AAA family ATPase [Capsulimonas sp.]|uniref:ATP-dependent nuclease n=1 Tax=Capsulimonas sp. TaxID=2494211 RepID=UPI0032672230